MAIHTMLDARDRASLVERAGRLAADTRPRWGRMEPAQRPAEHPLFGALSREEWGALEYRHLDHHLRQFGV